MLQPASSGKCNFAFTPDAEKTFHRGQTQYFLHNRKNRPAFPATPKSIGKLIGSVGAIKERSIEIITEVDLHNGDGLCYFDNQNNLVGFRVNRVEGRWVHPHGKISPLPGAKIYRNNDVQFNRSLHNSRKCRKIEVAVTVTEIPTGLSFTIVDEDGITSCCSAEFAEIAADQPEKTLQNIVRQVQKSGDTIFIVSSTKVEVNPKRYYSGSLVKELRRKAFAAHLPARLRHHKRAEVQIHPAAALWPGGKLSYRDNITNSKAEAFYVRHGAVLAGERQSPEKLMTCRYCIKRQLRVCPKEAKENHCDFTEPFTLADKSGEYRLVFDCHRCEMTVEELKSVRIP